MPSAPVVVYGGDSGKHDKYLAQMMLMQAIMQASASIGKGFSDLWKYNQERKQQNADLALKMIEEFGPENVPTHAIENLEDRYGFKFLRDENGKPIIPVSPAKQFERATFKAKSDIINRGGDEAGVLLGTVQAPRAKSEQEIDVERNRVTKYGYDVSKYGHDVSKYGHELGYKGNLASAGATVQAAQIGAASRAADRAEQARIERAKIRSEEHRTRFEKKADLRRDFWKMSIERGDKRFENKERVAAKEADLLGGPGGPAAAALYRTTMQTPAGQTIDYKELNQLQTELERAMEASPNTTKMVQALAALKGAEDPTSQELQNLLFNELLKSFYDRPELRPLIEKLATDGEGFFSDSLITQALRNVKYRRAASFLSDGPQEMGSPPPGMDERTQALWYQLYGQGPGSTTTVPESTPTTTPTSSYPPTTSTTPPQEALLGPAVTETPVSPSPTSTMPPVRFNREGYMEPGQDMDLWSVLTRNVPAMIDERKRRVMEEYDRRHRGGR